MFNKIAGLFKKNESTPPKGEKLPGTDLSYDPGLINQLENDHETLLEMYGDIVKNIKIKNFKDIHNQLLEFAPIMHSHLLHENLHLYVYLIQAFINNPEQSNMVNEMNKEMSKIGQKINHCLATYTKLDEWTKDTKESFKKDFEAIGKTLVERIKREEESLYSLYLPPSSYNHTSN